MRPAHSRRINAGVVLEIVVFRIIARVVQIQPRRRAHVQSMTSVAMWSGMQIARKLPGYSAGAVAEMAPVVLSKTPVIARRIAPENAAEMAFVMISI